MCFSLEESRVSGLDMVGLGIGYLKVLRHRFHLPILCCYMTAGALLDSKGIGYLAVQHASQFAGQTSLGTALLSRGSRLSSGITADCCDSAARGPQSDSINQIEIVKPEYHLRFGFNSGLLRPCCNWAPVAARHNATPQWASWKNNFQS